MSLRRRSGRTSLNGGILGQDSPQNRDGRHGSLFCFSSAVPSDHFASPYSHPSSGRKGSFLLNGISSLWSTSSATWSPTMYKALFIAGIVLAIAPWMYHSQLDWKARSLMATLDSLQSKVERMSAEIKRHHATLKDQEKEAEQLDNENRLLYEQLKARGDDVSYLENSEDRDAYYESEISEEAFLERIDGIESAFQKKCKQMVVSKFGVGPYLVNVTVQENLLATDPKERRKRAWFVVEMAPLSLMPHAVDHFLRLMDLGVWNGLTLIHSTENSVNFNDGDSSFIQPSPKLIYSSEMAADMSSSTLKSHTTVAATVVVEGSDTSNHYKRAAKGHLTQLAFTEQSPDYPIEKYSVVFSGRPGGPNFYINMEDNTESQANEACFGKVVQGRDVLDRMVNPGTNAVPPVRMMGIESMTFVQQE